MSPVVIDASVGVEIVTDTLRGACLSAVMPVDAVGWVPQHFSVEVAGVIRHRTVVTRTLSAAAALTALDGSNAGICFRPSCRRFSHPPGSSDTR